MADALPSDETLISVVRPARRRQRSVRLVVAVSLMSLATVLVALALPTGSALWLGLAAVVSLVCGWASARIVWTEVLQSRREAARDRAVQAQAYRSMYAERAGEHAEFTTVMTDRLARREREVADLQAEVGRAVRRAAGAEARVQELEERVVELEVAAAERADELAVWDPEAATADSTADPTADPTADVVADLVAWEARASSARAAAERKRA